jgi:serine phosphatase RsbU (regulator of sigma subunit)
MSTAIEVENKLAAELELARQVQTGLLPKRSCCLGSWMFAFSYESAAAVGGDYVASFPWNQAISTSHWATFPEKESRRPC